MTESVQMLPLLMGVAITLAMLAKALLGKIGIPALVGYLTLGFLLKLGNWAVP